MNNIIDNNEDYNTKFDDENYWNEETILDFSGIDYITDKDVDLINEKFDLNV